MMANEATRPLPRRFAGGLRRRTVALGRAPRTYRNLPPRQRWTLGAAAIVVLAALITGIVLLTQSAGTTVTAYFTQTVGVFPGSDVRILGVRVGTVDAVQPDGSQVKVTFTVDAGVPVPLHADAAVVTPSVVADRYIQLAPAYTAGPRLQSGAVIPAGRTAVPAEVDEIYASLNNLLTDLGPKGVNSHGALSNLINTGAANLRGNGQNLNQMLTQYSKLSKTLGANAGNLFGTISYLQQFTTMLKTNNSQVNQAEQQLANVTGFLAADRQDLAGALSNLATALSQVQTFIADNRGLIKSNVSKLATITQLLANERASLAETLNSAPLAADNLLAAYNGTARAFTGRGDLNELCLGPAARSLGCPANPNAAARTSAVTSADMPAIPPGSVPAGGATGLPPLLFAPVGLYATPDALTGGTR
jgi:phospholipid/cholesterol/gamma-HCH transport system substrate-binding protein